MVKNERIQTKTVLREILVIIFIKLLLISVCRTQEYLRAILNYNKFSLDNIGTK